MKYTNAPVYIGLANTDSLTEDASYLLSKSVSIDFPTSVDAKRKLGPSVSQGDQFMFNGPSEVKIDVDFYFHVDMPTSNEDGYLFLYDDFVLSGVQLGNASGENYFPIQIGNNIYKKCRLDEFDVAVRPFEPVMGRASFTCYSAPTLESISGDYSVSSVIESALDSNKIIYGNHCSVGGASQVVAPNIQSSISYNKKYNRTPVYGIGSSAPVRYLVDSVEADMSIESTGLNSFVNWSGKMLTSDLSVSLGSYTGGQINPSGATSFRLAIPSGARVYAEKYSIAEGDSVLTSVSLRQIIV